MALHESVVREQNAKIAELVHTPTFLVVAASLPGLFVANTLATGFAIGLVSAVSILAMAALAPLLAQVTGTYSRIPVTLLAAACVTTLVGFVVRVAAPVVNQSLGAYVALTSVNAMTMAFVAQDGFAAKPLDKSSLATAVFAAACACVALTLIGFFNGLLSSGEIFGFSFSPLASSPLAAFAKPTGSLLLMAVAATFVQALDTPLPQDDQEGEDA